MANDNSNNHANGARFPTNKAEAELLDEGFLQAFDKLSVEEHEKIQFEIHGISQFDQDPPSVETKLLELQEELDAVPEKTAFDKARSFNKRYTDSRPFRLMFLRSQRFHVQQAAQTLVMHFECKRRLFGDGEILGREVRLSDLSGGALDTLESGTIQVLPTRDVAGRAVLAAVAEWDEGVSSDDVARASWYHYMTVVQDDEETQRRGVVSLWYRYSMRRPGPNLNEDLFDRVQGIPGKLTCIHYCTTDGTMAPFPAGVRHFLRGNEQFRFRSHVGNPKQIDFTLQTFGIPTQDGPMRPDGSWSVEWHNKWMDQQRERGSGENCQVESVVLPRRFDVLFGSSKRTREHTGTMRLLHLCEMNYVAYEAANKYQKTEIAERLVSIVHQSDGRFLKKKDNELVEVSDLTARDKISHFFRHLRSNSRKRLEANSPVHAVTV